MNMSPNELLRLQRIMALLSLGILEALNDELISIREAELLLFSPANLKMCERIGAEPELYDLIHIGTELDSIKDLLTAQDLINAVSKIRSNAKSLLSRIGPSDTQLDRWDWQLN